jgi:hypothetical protein
MEVSLSFIVDFITNLYQFNRRPPSDNTEQLLCTTLYFSSVLFFVDKKPVSATSFWMTFAKTGLAALQNRYSINFWSSLKVFQLPVLGILTPH